MGDGHGSAVVQPDPCTMGMSAFRYCPYLRRALFYGTTGSACLCFRSRCEPRHYIHKTFFIISCIVKVLPHCLPRAYARRPSRLALLTKLCMGCIVARAIDMDSLNVLDMLNLLLDVNDF